MYLTNNKDKIRVTTTVAGNMSVYAAWSDMYSGTTLYGRNIFAIKKVETSAIVDSKGSSTTHRHITSVVITNSHSTLGQTVTIDIYDGEYASILWRGFLLPGEYVTYNGETWTKTIQTDTESFEIKASSQFSATEVLTDAIDLRSSPGGVAIWVVITDLGSVTQLDLYAYTSDSPSGGLEFNATVKSDDGINSGTFTASTYKMRLTTAANTLAVGVNGPFRLPQVSGAIKVGLLANHASGAYTVKAQRYT